MDTKTAETPDVTAEPIPVAATPVPGSSIPPEELEQLTADIVAALKTVYDPEIPADIYELGLIYKIDVDDARNVAIEMTLTAPGCPVAGEMPTWVENAVASVAGVGQVSVKLTFDPPWDKDRMSDEAKLALGHVLTQRSLHGGGDLIEGAADGETGVARRGHHRRPGGGDEGPQQRGSTRTRWPRCRVSSRKNLAIRSFMARCSLAAADDRVLPGPKGTSLARSGSIRRQSPRPAGEERVNAQARARQAICSRAWQPTRLRQARRGLSRQISAQPALAPHCRSSAHQGRPRLRRRSCIGRSGRRGWRAVDGARRRTSVAPALRSRRSS